MATTSACVTEDSADLLDTSSSADPTPPDHDNLSASPLTTTALATSTCPVSNTNISRSLAVTDPTVLAKLSFARVMNQVRATASVASTPTTPSVFQAWMKTFGSSAAAGD